jgi:hypothetical protein
VTVTFQITRTTKPFPEEFGEGGSTLKSVIVKRPVLLPIITARDDARPDVPRLGRRILDKGHGSGAQAFDQLTQYRTSVLCN